MAPKQKLLRAKEKRDRSLLLGRQKELKQNKSELKTLGSSKKNTGILEYFKNVFSLPPKKTSIEDTLPYLKMYKDGICRVSKNHYNKMISFEDINYKLALEDEKDIIFNQFANFLNSFDSTTSVQFCFANETGRNKESEKAIKIPPKDDGFDFLRTEYRTMLKDQLAKGNNGIKKSKYIIFGVDAENFKQAKTNLERIEMNAIDLLSGMGVRTTSLKGEDRLKVLHDLMRPDEEFKETWNDIVEKKQGTKIHVAPHKMNFKPKEYFKMDDYICSVGYMQILANELSDEILSDLLELNGNLIVSFHIKAIDQLEAIKIVKRKNTDVQKMTIEEQKKAVRAGYDMDIISSDLSTYAGNMDFLLKELLARDEKMFIVSICIMTADKSRAKLDTAIKQLASTCNRHNCVLKRLTHQQEQGFVSAMPFGVDEVVFKRELTSSSTAVFMPFKTQELFISSDTSVYYGLNTLSRNVIMADRAFLLNPNGLILGTPGSGKSFAAKREIVNSILVSDDDVIVCDPEGEYGELVRQFGGEVVNISAKSKDYLNPLDINMNYGDGDAPLRDKSNFILSMFELVVGGDGLSAAERSVIDRCLPKIYEKFFETTDPKDLPILQDLYEMLLSQEGEVGKKLAVEMEIYVKGSLNVFNHPSNIDMNKKLLCFNIKELGSQLKKIGMLVIQDQVWNKVSANRGTRRTRYYLDEFHLLLREPQTAQYSTEIWKRFRKWGGVPTGITQNVKDLLMSKEIENIFDNTDFIMMLNQAPGDREILADKLKISPYQLKRITNSPPGEGLLFFGDVIIPFQDTFPEDTKLYKMMTTRPGE